MRLQMLAKTLMSKSMMTKKKSIPLQVPKLFVVELY